MITIEQGKKIIENYNYLIGEKYKGVKITDLLITPKDNPEFKESLKLYLRSNDSSKIIKASSEKGYIVTAISNQEILFHCDLFDILKTKNIPINLEDFK